MEFSVSTGVLGSTDCANIKCCKVNIYSGTAQYNNGKIIML